MSRKFRIVPNEYGRYNLEEEVSVYVFLFVHVPHWKYIADGAHVVDLEQRVKHMCQETKEITCGS